jgi:hypothetical protein
MPPVQAWGLTGDEATLCVASFRLGLFGFVLGFRRVHLGLYRVCLGFGRGSIGFGRVRIGLKLAFTRGFWGFTEKKTVRNRAVSATFEQNSFSFFKKLIVLGQNRKPGQGNYMGYSAGNAGGQEKAAFCREEKRGFWGAWRQKSDGFWKKTGVCREEKLCF